MNISNRKCIRHLSWKAMGAARARNLIAVLAIALTTILFTTLFTIALSINYSIQQANFRQAGGYGHASFKNITEEQVNELCTDPLIKEFGLRRIVGMPEKIPFNKAHVEVSWCDQNSAKSMFIEPVEGRLPQEGTQEAATDTRVLSLLGIEPKLGEEFTLTFNVDGKETTENFTLCGWWKYDKAVPASHVLIPESLVNEIFTKLDTQGLDGMTSFWSMDVMFANAAHIEKDVQTVLENHGYQTESRAQGNFIATGINWGYTGAQLNNSMDPETVLSIGALLLLIIFTGYLIIYNVFQISVTGDIRFYGLLKTIGTTGRQLKRIIRQQALVLSVVGIPIGLLAGYGLGVKLTPVILRQLNGVVVDAVSVSPLIFVGAAAFSLITVLLSCSKPGRMAARVSPIEAVRYTENSGSLKKIKKGQTAVSLPRMAWANLGRSRGKTGITILSLSLAVVLLNLMVTFTNGFDMDKYLSRLGMTSDFIVADAGYFQTGGDLWNVDMAVSEDVINQVQKQGDLTDGGRIYGLTSSVQEFITEDYFHSMWGAWNDPETLNKMIESRERSDTGLLAESAQLYGMERYPLEKLTVLEGDISRLYNSGEHVIAAVYSDDDYGNPEMNSHWARLGDKITLRHVDEFEYYDPSTGASFGTEPPADEQQNWNRRASKFKDVEYEVVALVTVPHTLSYRYYGSDEFVLNDQTFIQDTGTNSILQYSFDTTDESNAGMEAFLGEFTDTQQPSYDYESKQSYASEFNSFKNMFLLLGGVLSFIIGLVGILNFLNAVLTGIMTRKREFAVLQSIGMTGKQLKAMLVWEGLYYALGAVTVSLVFSLASWPLMASAMGGMFWFFTYRFTLLPVSIVAPIFALLGALLPLAIYRSVSRYSIVERLREAE